MFQNRKWINHIKLNYDHKRLYYTLLTSSHKTPNTHTESLKHVYHLKSCPSERSDESLREL